MHTHDQDRQGDGRRGLYWLSVAQRRMVKDRVSQLGKGLGLGILFLSMTVACVMRHPAAIAPSSIPLTTHYVELGKVSRESCGGFLGLGIKDTPVSLMAKAVKELGGDALIGLTIEHEVTMYGVFYRTCSVLNATVVKMEG